MIPENKFISLFLPCCCCYNFTVFVSYLLHAAHKVNYVCATDSLISYFEDLVKKLKKLKAWPFCARTPSWFVKNLGSRARIKFFFFFYFFIYYRLSKSSLSLPLSLSFTHTHTHTHTGHAHARKHSHSIIRVLIVMPTHFKISAQEINIFIISHNFPLPSVAMV